MFPSKSINIKGISREYICVWSFSFVMLSCAWACVKLDLQQSAFEGLGMLCPAQECRRSHQKENPRNEKVLALKDKYIQCVITTNLSTIDHILSLWRVCLSHGVPVRWVVLCVRPWQHRAKKAVQVQSTSFFTLHPAARLWLENTVNGSVWLPGG